MSLIYGMELQTDHSSDKDHSHREISRERPKEKKYEQKLRTMSTSELIQEMSTLKWHYALFKDQKKFEMACAVEMEIARRKGSLKPSVNNGVER